MTVSRRWTLACAVCAATAPFSSARASSSMPHTTLTPDQALARLMQGNRNFVADNPVDQPQNISLRRTLATGQAPFATVLGCADSRVDPATLFGTRLGELFGVRVAGNTVSPSDMGSLEYSSVALGVPLVMVLGHTRCGAVGAAVEVVERGTRFPGSIMAVVEPIIPAVQEAKLSNPADLVEATVRVHAVRTAHQIKQSDSALSPRIADGSLKVVAAYYDLDDGEVHMLTI